MDVFGTWLHPLLTCRNKIGSKGPEIDPLKQGGGQGNSPMANITLPHCKSVEEVLKFYEVKADEGLSSSQVEENRAPWCCFKAFSFLFFGNVVVPWLCSVEKLIYLPRLMM